MVVVMVAKWVGKMVALWVVMRAAEMAEKMVVLSAELKVDKKVLATVTWKV
jgi:hypothetical protein